MSIPSRDLGNKIQILFKKRMLKTLSKIESSGYLLETKEARLHLQLAVEPGAVLAVLVLQMCRL